MSTGANKMKPITALTILNLSLMMMVIIIIILPTTNAFSSRVNTSSGSKKLLEICKEARNDQTTRNAIILPGVHDALSAKIFAQQGAKALFISGFGVSASKLGQPDLGLLTQTEMEQTLKNVVRAVAPYSTPIIVDGDTGYGGTMNIRRTIRDFAAAGAAAVSIEDQIFPKKCTYAAGSGVKVVSFEECKERIKIALAARDEARDIDGNDILILARTDCRAALGLEEAVRRCKMFEELGADICYAENLQSKDEYIHLAENLNPSTLKMLAQVHLFPHSTSEEVSDEQMLFTAREVGLMNYDLALFGVTPLQSVVNALENTATEMLGNGGSSGFVQKSQSTSFQQLKSVVGFTDADQFESSLKSS